MTLSLLFESLAHKNIEYIRLKIHLVHRTALDIKNSVGFESMGYMGTVPLLICKENSLSSYELS